jgi:hypothetical protein
MHKFSQKPEGLWKLALGVGIARGYSSPYAVSFIFLTSERIVAHPEVIHSAGLSSKPSNDPSQTVVTPVR